MKRTHGYSLFELLIVLTLAAAIVVTSVPFLIQYAENSRFENAARRVVFHIRRTKMLAITKGESYAVCVPLGDANWKTQWRFFTVKNTETCEIKNEKLIDTAISYEVFQKSGETEMEKISFHGRGTSRNKSFCIKNKTGTKWKKITVSNFARITTQSDEENPCD